MSTSRNDGVFTLNVIERPRKSHREQGEGGEVGISQEGGDQGAGGDGGACWRAVGEGAVQLLMATGYLLSIII